MYRNIKPGFGLVFFVLLGCAAAVGGAVYLGKLYLGIIKEANVPRSTRVNTENSRPVTAQDNQKLLLLNPIPVYYLQAGVYSDLKGAREAVRPIEELGYIPYITRSAPYRIWIGVYQKRNDADTIKGYLRDKGIGSFTGSVVINGSNLKYGKGSEVFIKEISPLLETYTTWLKENLELFNADSVDRLNWSVIEKQSPVIAKVYKDIQGFENETKTNRAELNEKLRNISETVERYNIQLNIFKKQRNQQNYMVLQSKLLEFIDSYLHLWQEIDHISKT